MRNGNLNLGKGRQNLPDGYRKFSLQPGDEVLTPNEKLITRMLKAGVPKEEVAGVCQTILFEDTARIVTTGRSAYEDSLTNRWR